MLVNAPLVLRIKTLLQDAQEYATHLLVHSFYPANYLMSEKLGFFLPCKSNVLCFL